MFKTIDLQMQVGPIKQWWLNLNRRIQTEIEHRRVTNDTVADMVRGDIVCYTAGNRQAHLAQADAAATARWAAVMAEPTPAGEQGIARTDGYTLIRMQDDEGAIAGAEGQPIFLSPTVAGAGTLAQPDGDGDFVARVAILADASEYSALNPFVWGILGHCCAPSEDEPEE